MTAEDAREVANIIITHGRETSQEPGQVLQDVANGTLVVALLENTLTLLYDSPNGL